MLSPVILFVYNRPDHTLKTLEALAACEWAEKTELFIYADGAKENSSPQNIEKIQAVRQIIAQKQWCGKVNIIASEKNKGLARSIISGVTEVIEKYGKVIVLEDDLIVFKGFLRFMNEALDMYEKEENVFGISGFAYFSPIADQLPDTYFLPVLNSWGWATWKRSWQHFEVDTHNILKKLQEKGITQEMYNFGGYYYYQILLAQAEGKVESWATRFMASAVLQGGLFLYPRHSLIENIGFDNTGTHCSSDELFFTKITKADYIPVKKIPISAHNEGRKSIENHFRAYFAPSVWQRIQNKLKNVF